MWVLGAAVRVGEFDLILQSDDRQSEHTVGVVCNWEGTCLSVNPQAAEWREAPRNEAN